jgi:hypothetical protein
LYGLDLFNHGYYWEAHEAWEGLWHACGRRGRTADFLKGLIKLAAAGVKARAGQPRGVQDHAHRAAELFERTMGSPGSEDVVYMGLSLPELIRQARGIAAQPPRAGAESGRRAEIVFDFLLRVDIGSELAREGPG